MSDPTLSQGPGGPSAVDPALMQILLMAARGMSQDATAQAPRSYGNATTPLSLDAWRSSPFGMAMELTPPGSVAGGAVDLKQGIQNRDVKQAGLGILGLLALGGIAGDLFRGKGYIADAFREIGSKKRLAQETEGLINEIKLAKTPIEALPRGATETQRLQQSMLDLHDVMRATSQIDELMQEGKTEDATAILKALIATHNAPAGREADKAWQALKDTQMAMHDKSMAEWSAGQADEGVDYYKNRRQAEQIRSTLGTDQPRTRRFQPEGTAPRIPVDVSNPPPAVEKFLSTGKHFEATDYMKMLKADTDPATREWLKKVNDEVVARHYGGAKELTVYRLGGHGGEYVGVTDNPYTAEALARKGGVHVAKYLIKPKDIALDVRAFSKLMGKSTKYYTSEQLIVPWSVLKKHPVP